MIKDILKIISASSVCFCLCPAISLISCSNENNPKVVVDSLVINSDVKSLMPGEGAYVWCIAYPYEKRFTDVTWEIIESPNPQITIDKETGYINIPSTVVVGDITTMIIKAKCNHQDVDAIKKLYVVPYSDSRFIGFENNKISYFDRELIPHTQEIIKNDKKYSCSTNIDVFVGIGDYFKPEGFVSKINFVPICTGTLGDVMLFSLRENKLHRHGISWTDYSDDEATTQIPDFQILDPTVMFETIDVNFLADPNVTFSIRLSLWHNPDQAQHGGYMTYTPTLHDTQKLVYDSRGRYSTDMFAPTDMKTKYTGVMDSIYCSRPRYEYSDFEISFDYSFGLPNEIKKCIDFNLTNELIVRPLDHYRYYKISISYTFDSSLLEYPPKHWDYNEYESITVSITDRIHTTDFVCVMSFYLNWL